MRDAELDDAGDDHDDDEAADLALDHDLAAQAIGTRPPMRLISVRFGNVLASNGSVVPKFKAQIEAGDR